jgi:hypothetical protein
MQATLAHLGVGPMPTDTPQTNTLDVEVAEYLAAKVGYANIIEFWQVCGNGQFCLGALTVVEMAETPDSMANTLQACHGLNPHPGHFSAM